MWHFPKVCAEGLSFLSLAHSSMSQMASATSGYQWSPCLDYRISSKCLFNTPTLTSQKSPKFNSSSFQNTVLSVRSSNSCSGAEGRGGPNGAFVKLNWKKGRQEKRGRELWFKCHRCSLFLFSTFSWKTFLHMLYVFKTISRELKCLLLQFLPALLVSLGSWSTELLTFIQI